jgi:hypothetical protein
MSYLREKQVFIDSLGESLVVRELPSIGQLEILEHQEKPFEGVFIACKYGVKAWSDLSLDEIKSMISMRQASEISSVVFELSGVDEKNSESGPSADSSSG